MSQESPQQWVHMTAGSIAGAVAVLMLHPFDVIKTRLQVQDSFKGPLPPYKGTWDAVKSIARHEGLGGFYAGLTPSLVGSGVAWGAYFYMYEGMKKFYMRRQNTEQLSATWHLLSAAQAGAVVCMLTNPIWVVKTRLALQGGALLGGSSVPSVRYTGFVDALVKVWREEGIRGYYKGLGPSLVLQTTHGAVQFAIYEELKWLASGSAQLPWLLQRSRDAAGGKSGEQERDDDQVDGPGDVRRPRRQLTSVELSVYGALSKFCAQVTTYPAQVVRSRLQQRHDESRARLYSNGLAVARLTWRHEGLLGFYKGLVPSLLRVMPQSAITLVVYENVTRWLNDLQQQQQQKRHSKQVQQP